MCIVVKLLAHLITFQILNKICNTMKRLASYPDFTLNRYIQVAFEASSSARVQSVTVNMTGFGFNTQLRKRNIYLNLY